MQPDLRLNLHVFCAVLFVLLATARPGVGAEDLTAPLPPGVKAVWDADKAHRESTATHERICLNGLWQWQPANTQSEQAPAGKWGWFKVPGCWPGISDYMQKDCQTVFAHPAWKSQNLSSLSTAWYQRKITVPSGWVHRRIALRVEYLNSFAVVFVDGQRAGELRFPGGELDLNVVCRPGETHTLSLLVIAMPLKDVLLSYGDTFGVKQVNGTVERRGLCGDVYLVGTPWGVRLADVRVRTSVRKQEITFEAAPLDLAADVSYALHAKVGDSGRSVVEFTSKPFTAADLKEGRIAFTESWRPGKLWDTHTPQNMYELRLSLVDGAGKILDAALPERFGFREFWIDGRDFYLNDSRIFLCAVPFDNAQIGAAWATYESARESMERLKSFGVNFVYTHNYGCEPGTHLSFAEILRAADDEGMLVSFSQPHFGQYQWKSPDADQTNGYARHAAFYVQAAENHPSVVFYSMSHNATGTEEEMNPDMIDGVQDVRNQWSGNNVKQALRAEAIVNQLDPGRIVYHHCRAISARCTRRIFTPTSPRSRKCPIGSSTGLPRA
jgi:beta-galactosidase/beta-glucuronidase